MPVPKSPPARPLATMTCAYRQRSQGARATLSLALLSGLIVCTLRPAYAAGLDARDIADLSLEELATVRVTSVSKRPESLAEAPSSVFVITGNDIRRSGSTTLPEALRLAPNLQVARVDARNYAVTARGFNSPFENKLLVLIDGRTVYSPLFSGVYWDAQDVVLEDVDRIEVISGPGGTLWGANAVNGVINVITKSAADTQGGLAGAGLSKNEKNGAFRYGGVLANGGHYRVYGKYADNDDTQRASGTPILTGWRRKQAGFRSDWGNSAQNFTVQGDTYDGYLHQQGTQDIKIAGANLLGRVSTKMDDGSTVTLQTYWDYTERNQPNAFVEHLHTFDVQLQQARTFGESHNVVWGAGYRLALDRIVNERSFAFLPASLNMYWGNIFIQDEIALRDDLRLTAGLKIENNNYTGVETLPTLRLAWKPAANNLLWSSASRSVRTPSRIDRDFFSPATPTIVNGVPRFAVAGGPEFESEVANVLEVGYRVQPVPTITYSATAFYSRYDKLRTLEPNPNGFGSVFMNMAEGSARGIEMWGTWQARADWRLSAGLVAQKVDTTLLPRSRDASGATGLATSDPTHYWMLRSSYDIVQGQELDLTLRHVGGLPTPAVPSYTAIDLRYGWKIQRDLELSVTGQNLIDRSHAEYGSAPGRSEYERAFFIKLLWKQ
ncbi:TonB-dependent receptor plug domain-containing protein [Noviherbaspirillum sp. Root189]|uniref:TonB-dependent receptor plug domain-containing protein n=1 Tax=Noviherbaspirillum sp. Root189 TaxID=1736487 RepID=UPI001F1BEEB7|nr:TonB-dependent receptor [Noviherbaspirillum sp. Root189]